MASTEPRAEQASPEPGENPAPVPPSDLATDAVARQPGTNGDHDQGPEPTVPAPDAAAGNGHTAPPVEVRPRARRVVLADLAPPEPALIPEAEAVPLVQAEAPAGTPDGPAAGPPEAPAPPAAGVAAPAPAVTGVPSASPVDVGPDVPPVGDPALPAALPARRPVEAWVPGATVQPSNRARRGAGVAQPRAVTTAPLDPDRWAHAPLLVPAAERADPDDLALLPDAVPAAQPAAAPRGWRAAVQSSALLRSRAVLGGGLALALGLYAQRLVGERAIQLSIRWYAAAIILMVLAWLGTYRNKSMVLLPFRPVLNRGLPLRVVRAARARRGLPQIAPWRRAIAARPGLALLPRYAIALGALALNLWSTAQLRAHSYDSLIGGLGWLISLVLIVLAFLTHRTDARRAADTEADDVEERTDWHPPRWLEIAIFLGILALAFGLRFYRLDDWTTGMHGDEGEAGMDAIAIMEGNRVSPFGTGWFAQPNFYYWGIALTMWVFGTGMTGLRMFSTLAGTLMLVPFYPLVRQWFGVRCAMIASVFLAMSDVAIHFSRQEFSNITTPAFLVAGFYFLFRGLRDRRLINFVLAGYAHILTMYFYLGGRLTPIMMAAFVGYLFVLMPLLRLPGVYRALRRRVPDLSRSAAWGRAVRTQVRGVLLYVSPLLVYVIASICFVSPWYAYAQDNAAVTNARTNEKLIFYNEQRMASQYSASHEPLYIGLRAARPDDILPLPVVFEKTDTSLQLLPPTGPFALKPPQGGGVNIPFQVLKDGFWPRVLWGQLTTTLSILTYRFDASSVYTFTQEPVAKPIEAVLIILGIAWAAWRWRDTRFALLSLWFWSTVLVGGVLTIDAPYMARIIGMVPAMAILAAVPLNKLAAEFVLMVSKLGRNVTLRRVGLAVSGAAIGVLLGMLLVQNFTDYYGRYVAAWPFGEVTGQSYFVRWMNQQTAAEGRPSPRYYNLGAHLIYWGHGDNRFLNHGTVGSDMVNSSNELPVIENGDRDVVFMVWEPAGDGQYLPVIQQYYPEGSSAPFNYSPDGQGGHLFTWYRVTKEQIDAQRVLTTTYTPATGPAIIRREANLGSGDAPPADLAYPVQAQWQGGIVAPAFGRYRFAVEAPAGTQLIIDGQSVLTGTTAPGTSDHEVVLARGPHDVTLTSTLANADARVRVQWSVGGQVMAPVARKFLWGGPGKALLGEIRPVTGDPFGPLPPDTAGGATPVTQRRTDGFLGFRDAPNALSGGAPLVAAWTGTLTAPATGPYQFDIFSNGGSTITIDDNLVVDNRAGGFEARNAGGQATLTAGPHKIDVRYTWGGGTGYLEAYWTPPGGQKVLIGPANVHADGGIWQPGTITEPGNVQAQLGEVPPATKPDAVVDTHGELKAPRSLALDAAGNLIIADSENHRIAVLDKGGALVRTWGKEGKTDADFTTPEDVALGPDGKIYVLDSGLARISVFTPDGKLDHLINPGGWCSPAGFTIGADGFLYVADTCASRIRKFTLAGEPQREFSAGTAEGTRIDQPVDVAVDKDGTLYVADLRNRVIKLDPATDTISKTWPLQIGTAQGAANMTLAGVVLYLTDPDRGMVISIDTQSGRIDRIGHPGPNPGEFNIPLGIAAGPDGRIYVLESDKGRVQVFKDLVPK
ncbi:MAG TPA: PA14 domain-containing protein [Chloroflexia bacterium]|nr:PA14 domain-containing protein [Chloroflexia bacterium]